MIRVLFNNQTEDITDEERLNILEQIAKTDHGFYKHIHAFMDLITGELQDRQLYDRPNLRELLLRKVIMLDRIYNSFRNTQNVTNLQIIPICNDVKTGGAPPGMKFNPFKRPRMQQQINKAHHEETPGIIHVRFDVPVLCVRGAEYLAPAGEELNIIGVVCGVEPMIFIHDKMQPAAAINIPPKNTIMIGNTNFTTLHKQPAYIEQQYFLFADHDEQSQLVFLQGIFDYYLSLTAPYQQYIYWEQLKQIVQGEKYIAPYRNQSGELTTGPEFSIFEQFGLPHSGYTAMIGDLYHQQYANAFYLSMINRKQVEQALAQRQAIVDRSMFTSRQIEQDDMRAYAKNTILVTISKKISPARAREIETQMRLVANPLDLLKPAERKIVEIEMAARQSYLEAVINNKCPHVKLYSRFRQTIVTADAWKIFNQLKAYFDRSKPDQLISCSNCKLPIICPHIVEVSDPAFLQKRYMEQRSILHKYIADSHSRDYYCKICGELLISSIDIEDDAVGTGATMNEELKQFMWAEMGALSRYLKTNTVVDKTALITAQRDACYPFIFDIEKQILKSKTNSADEIKAKKRLFVTIFSFAWMIQCVLTHEQVEFKDFKLVDSSKKLPEMIKYAISQIMVYCNVVIKEIPGMSMEIIQTKLVEAYKRLQTEGITVLTAGEHENLAKTITLDPVYKYLFDMWIISDCQYNRKVSTKTTLLSQLPKIIPNIATLEKETVEKSGKKQITIGTDVYGKVDYPMFKNVQPSTYELARLKFAIDSFNMFAESLRSGRHLLPLYTNVTSKRQGSEHQHEVETVLNPEHVKLRQLAAEFAVRENELDRRLWSMYPRGAQSAGIKKIRPKQVTSLGRSFDESGRPHRWDIFITVADDDKVQEFKVNKDTNDIAKVVQSGKRFDLTIVDKKCSTCGLKFSQVDAIDEKKIRASLNAAVNKENFFRFYETRCPLGAAHTFDGTPPKCTKCNYVLGMAPSNEYFKTHSATWDEEKSSWVKNQLPTIEPAKPVIWSEKYAEDYAKYTFNHFVVVDLATKLGIQPRLLMALGAFEKIEYNDILSGAYIPNEAENRNDTRIYTLATHVKNLMTEYQQLRHFHKLIRPNPELVQIVEDTVGKHQMGSLSMTLPEVYEDFNAKFEYIQRVKKPREIVAFLIQTFCETALKIHSIKDPSASEPLARLRKAFVKYFVTKMLKSEEMLTKYGYFSWSLLHGDKEQKETVDANFDADADEDFVPDVAEDQEDTPFGTDALDVEESEDPDDNNQIRAGDNLGLD